MASIPQQSSKDKAKALRASVNASIESLAKAVDKVRASKTFIAYLNAQSKFHSYSWSNTLLICSQRPEASQVAGFKTWNTLGRYVRKGEKGIMIFAPRPYTRTDTASGEDVAGCSFRPVYVFDVDQTDGKDIPTVECPIIESAADTLLSALVTVAENRKIAVNLAPIDRSAFGTSHGGKVDVDNTYTTGQQAKTLAHELAHESMHQSKADREGMIRETAHVAELEAESVAYVVCQHFNLATEVRASIYIAIWNGDAKRLRASLDRIAKTARALIDDLTALTVAREAA